MDATIIITGIIIVVVVVLKFKRSFSFRGQHRYYPRKKRHSKDYWRLQIRYAEEKARDTQLRLEQGNYNDFYKRVLEETLAKQRAEIAYCERQLEECSYVSHT